MALTLAKAQEIASALEDLSNRQTTLYNDIRQVLDANTAQAPTWGLVAPITVTVGATDVTNNTLAATAHGLANGQKLQVIRASSATLPAPLVEGTDYYVVATAANAFSVAATRGGAAIDITGQSSGTVQVQPLPDYLSLDSFGNLTGTKYSPNDVSNAITALDQVRKLLGNVAVTAPADYLGSLNKLTRPAG